MAEAIVAFSLAGTILQFLDFSSKLASRFRDYYRSTRDGNDTVPNIHLLTNDLRNISKDLETEHRDRDAISRPFQNLAKNCGRVAEDLLAILESLRKKHASEGKASALRAAFRSIWKEEEIMGLQQQLDTSRSHLVLQIVSESRERIRSSRTQQMQLLQDIQKRIEKLDGNLKIKLTNEQADDGLGSRIVDVVVSKLASTDRIEQKSALENDLIRNLLDRDHKDSSTESTAPVVPNSQSQRIVQRILSHLRYEQIIDREDSIADAHAETFKWIFDTTSQHTGRWSDLATWLSTDDKLYWVTGKAGSGKSTLMKFISQPLCLDTQRQTGLTSSSRCDRYLVAWAPPPLTLIVAKFFFWSSGAEVQMSQSGLLRSLLWQILSQVPSLTPALVPLQWETMCLYGLDSVRGWNWKEIDLVNMLRKVVNILEPVMRLCLFIDGVDEFDGDHTLLVHLFKDLIQSTKVKICVSSRPWDIFERTFDQAPSLRMEYLTHHDIVAYTTERLHSNPIFNELRSCDPQVAGQLVKNVVSKAAGVFLWVKLVVSSLLSGLFDGDRISDLQQRLDELPPDLERLYEKMLDSIAPRNIEHTAQLLTIVAISIQPVNIMLLSFIDDEDYEAALERQMAPLEEKDESLRFEWMRRRLNSRTMGLLELNRDVTLPKSNSELTVQYLHKTVHDFLRSPKINDRLEGVLKSSFDVHMRICIGMLSYLKTRVPSEGWGDSRAEFWLDVTQFMYSASRVNPNSYADSVRIIDAFNETVTKQTSNSWWVREHPAFRHNPITCYHFLSFAIRHGIDYYVEARVTETCIVSAPCEKFILSSTKQTGTEANTFGYSLVADAVRFPIDDSSRRAWELWRLKPPNTAMLELLMKIGADRFPEDLRGASFSLAHHLCQEVKGDSSQIGKEESLVYLKIVQILVAHHDDIWPRKMFGAWDRKRKEYYYELIYHYAQRLGQLEKSKYGFAWSPRRILLSGDFMKKLYSSFLTCISSYLERFSA